MAQSILLLSTSTNNGVSGSYIGNPVRADGWYGRVDHIYTVAVYVSNLQGTVYLEASLANVPTEADWFAVVPVMTFPQPPSQTIVDGCPVINDTPGPGETARICTSFRANVTWIRARVVQTGSGFVDRILLNQ